MKLKVIKTFKYFQSRSILERHLVIADNVYTMNDLVAMTAASGDSILLPTYRDSLKVKVEEEAGRKYNPLFHSHSP